MHLKLHQLRAQIEFKIRKLLSKIIKVITMNMLLIEWQRIQFLISFKEILRIISSLEYRWLIRSMKSNRNNR
jgi:hypothetical protein